MSKENKDQEPKQDGFGVAVTFENYVNDVDNLRTNIRMGLRVDSVEHFERALIGRYFGRMTQPIKTLPEAYTRAWTETETASPATEEPACPALTSEKRIGQIARERFGTLVPLLNEPDATTPEATQFPATPVDWSKITLADYLVNKDGCYEQARKLSEFARTTLETMLVTQRQEDGNHPWTNGYPAFMAAMRGVKVSDYSGDPHWHSHESE